MVYLLRMVIFHGYVSHNQMVTPITHPFKDGLPMKMVIFHGYQIIFLELFAPTSLTKKGAPGLLSSIWSWRRSAPGGAAGDHWSPCRASCSMGRAVAGELCPAHSNPGQLALGLCILCWWGLDGLVSPLVFCSPQCLVDFLCFSRVLKCCPPFPLFVHVKKKDVRLKTHPTGTRGKNKLQKIPPRIVRLHQVWRLLWHRPIRCC